MSAPLAVTAAPAGGPAAAKTGPAAGAEGFGDALSTVLAGLDPAGTAPTDTVPAQQPFDADSAASAQDAGAAAPQFGPVDPATQSPPAIFQLPLTPPAAVADSARLGAAEATSGAQPPAQPPVVSAGSAPGEGTVGGATGPGMPSPASRRAPLAAAQQTAAPVTAPAGTAAPAAASVPAASAPSTAVQPTTVHAGRADGRQPAAAPAAVAAENAPLPALQSAGPPAGAAVADSAGLGAAEATSGAQPPAQPPVVSAGSAPGQGTAGTAAPAAASVPAVIAPSTAVHAGRADGRQPAVAPAAAAEYAPLYAPPAPQAAAAAAAPAGSQAPAVPVPVPQGLAAQLVRPVFTLVSAGMGQHTITVAVNPENLGPVTVQAHIGPAGIRVELFAANTDGRDVLRQILPDLKRELAGAGLNASLDLSSGNQPDGRQPDDAPGGREPFTTRGPAFAYPDGTDSRQLPVNEPTSRAGSLYGVDGSLDVMA